MNILINVFSCFVGAYIIAETVAQLDQMNGEKICRIAKYVLAGVSGLWLIWEGVTFQAHLSMVLMGAALALFIWPRTWQRVEKYINDFWGGLHG